MNDLAYEVIQQTPKKASIKRLAMASHPGRGMNTHHNIDSHDFFFPGVKTYLFTTTGTVVSHLIIHTDIYKILNQGILKKCLEKT